MIDIYLVTGASLATAGINTLLGMGTVFIALIVISFIISLLKPLSDLFIHGFNKNKSVNVSEANATEPVATNIGNEEVDLDSETELVAVITAAIMASYQDNNYTPDGLVVRKIRRLSK